MNYKNIAEILLFIESKNLVYMCQVRSFLKSEKPYLLPDLEENEEKLKLFMMKRRGVM